MEEEKKDEEGDEPDWIVGDGRQLLLLYCYLL